MIEKKAIKSPTGSNLCAGLPAMAKGSLLCWQYKTDQAKKLCLLPFLFAQEFLMFSIT
jgi:hypothetical protein